MRSFRSANRARSSTSQSSSQGAVTLLTCSPALWSPAMFQVGRSARGAKCYCDRPQASTGVFAIGRVN
jgi:hypothetical protein